MAIHDIDYGAIMLRHIPGDASNPLDLSMFVEDSERSSMDVTHAPVGPHDAVLLDDSLTAQDKLCCLESALPVLRMERPSPLISIHESLWRATPDPLIGGADVFHSRGSS